MSAQIMPAHSAETERYTPEWIFKGIDRQFDLDPCAPAAAVPSKTYCDAYYALQEGQDGLALPWDGFVWLNPPWARGAKRRWIERLYRHGHGIALVRGGVDSAWLHDFPPRAILLLRGRVKYLLPDGQTEKPRKGKATGGLEPSMLLGYGLHARITLSTAKLPGLYCDALPTDAVYTTDGS